MLKLDIYVSEACWTCQETARIVVDVAAQCPEVKARVLDTAVFPPPDVVFAVPTYLLNGRVIFMGNPTRAQLLTVLKQSGRLA